MRLINFIVGALACTLFATATAKPHASSAAASTPSHTPITPHLHTTLSNLSLLVDITYCIISPPFPLSPFMPSVPGTGIHHPFRCASHCSDFPGAELVTTWNTGPLLSDSAGYVVVDHQMRWVVAAFRGTYSLASTLVDLGLERSGYVPFEPGKEEDMMEGFPVDGAGKIVTHDDADVVDDNAQAPTAPATHRGSSTSRPHRPPRCPNCTVHTGFNLAWQHTRPHVLPAIHASLAAHPDYTLHLAGHSLGGAVAAIAGLELSETLCARGYRPLVVTTFGQPRLGNGELAGYLEGVFGLDGHDASTTPDTHHRRWQHRKHCAAVMDTTSSSTSTTTNKDNEHNPHTSLETQRYRRITHRHDPIPLLPPTQWGWSSHAGEIYISSDGATVDPRDVWACVGRADGECIAGDADGAIRAAAVNENAAERATHQLLPNPHFRPWHLLSAHREYFHKLGLCVPSVGHGEWWWWGRE